MHAWTVIPRYSLVARDTLNLQEVYSIFAHTIYSSVLEYLCMWECAQLDLATKAASPKQVRYVPCRISYTAIYCIGFQIYVGPCVDYAYHAWYSCRKEQVQHALLVL